MSVSVHKLVKDKVSLNQSVIKQNSAAITTISVTARIDYILRFSKQSVLVVDDNTELYSKVASQFLGALTNKNNTHINAAFIGASTQLNDIQMRCRLIEQLFSDTLFDPEQSLVVSILRLVQKQPQAITIVIEHAQSLSLQLKYELSQLAEAARKTSNIINVVMFGSTEAAQQVASERPLFGNNLAIILADSGQVMSINHQKFKNKKLLLTWVLLKSSMRIISTVVLISVLSWIALTNYDDLKLKVDGYIALITQEKLAKKENVIKSETLLIENKQMLTNGVVTNKEVISNENLASYQDINQALLSGNMANAIVSSKEKSVNNDQIIKVLSPVITENKKTVLKKEITLVKTEKPIAENKNVPVLPLDSEYYLASQHGYIIQIAGFSDEFIFKKFLEEYPKVELYSYQRLLNNTPFIVLTSKIYANKSLALRAINTLPESMQKRGLWVKPVNVVKKEIKPIEL